MAESENIAHGFAGLVNAEFRRAWGEPGAPGDDKLIVQTCRLFAEMCRSALKWEESVRFTRTHDIFEEVRRLFIGIAGNFIDEVSKLPRFLTDVLDDPSSTGTQVLDMKLTMPDGWNEAVSKALKRATVALAADY
ncbi:MAG: hypothetical protein ACJ8ER_17420 [Allosphingosinicella sp.]